MEFIPEWAPNVHPMFVHFPIGLLFTALALDLLGLLTSKLTWLRAAAILLYVLGALAALFAYLSGESAAEDILVPAAAEGLLTEHEQLAFWTLMFFGVYAVVRLVIEALTRGGRLWMRVALLILAVPGAVLVWETAEHGSELVYNHGVGVRAVAGERESPEAPAAPQASGIELNENGSWNWRPTGAAPNDSLVRWIEGSPNDLTLTADSTAGAVLRSAQAPIMFVVDSDLEKTQVAAELNPGDAGIMLVHHLQPNGDFEFLELVDGRLRLGRMRDGQVSVADSAEVDAGGWLRLRAAGDGSHFRGYVNDRLLVHAHWTALPPGPAGIRITRADTLQLRSLGAQPL